MPTLHRYVVVDVFTTEALAGNPLAVFPDASAFDGTTMQRIARELNLAETAFVLPPTRPGCVARVRIFTPAKEMDFAGHPTVGTAFVLWQRGAVPAGQHEFSLDEAVGTVPLRFDGGERPLFWLRMPPVREGKRYDAALCARVLGLEAEDLLPLSPQMLSAGNPTVVVAARSTAVVDRAWLDLAGLKTLQGGGHEPFCVFLFARTEEGAYSRMFAPAYGVPEDPASGSCVGPLAVFMMRHGLVPATGRTRFVSEQGTQMGRRSLLHAEIIGNSDSVSIYVGGHVTPIIDAVMTI